MLPSAGFPAPAIKERLWRTALDDARLSIDGIHRFDGTSRGQGGVLGQYWPPGHDVDDPQPRDRVQLADRDLDVANRVPLAHKHRIAIAPILDLPAELAEGAFMGLVRHELEHARQWNECKDEPFELRKVADMVYVQATGSSTIPSTFFNQLPVEKDANAAASVFLHQARPDLAEGLLGHELYAPLAQAHTELQPLETLLKRMVCFLFLRYRPVLEAMAARHIEGGTTVKDFLRMADAPNAAQIWQDLTEHRGE